MSLKAILFSLGYIVAWFVLLPLVVIGGGLALFLYAVLAELGALITGNPGKIPDTTVVREIAHRMCGGYDVQSRSSRRLPSP